MAPRPQRKSPRKFVIGIGEIAGPNNSDPVYCTLCDISATGALVEVPPGYRFPQTFSLKRIATNETRPARLVWKRYTLAGIAFTA